MISYQLVIIFSTIFLLLVIYGFLCLFASYLLFRCFWWLDDWWIYKQKFLQSFQVTLGNIRSKYPWLKNQCLNLFCTLLFHLVEDPPMHLALHNLLISCPPCRGGGIYKHHVAGLVWSAFNFFLFIDAMTLWPMTFMTLKNINTFLTFQQVDME